MKKGQKISLLVLGILLIICLTLGISYAAWSLNLKQKEKNTISTGCFKVTFSDINPMNLQNAFPIYDEEGKTSVPYEFTITNTCESEANYQINLEILNNSTLTELKYIKEYLTSNEEILSFSILNENTVTNKTLENASVAYKLNTGVLKREESKTFKLRLWMDKDTLATESAMNKTLNTKVTVVTSYKVPVDTTNMMKPRYIANDNVEWWNKEELKYDIDNYEIIFGGSTKVIFESKLNPIEGAEEFDISYNEDRSVLAYVKVDENEGMITYIQANGKVKLPEISAFLFSNLIATTNIEGLENVDTKEVTTMRGMFLGMNNLTNLDLSYFDTFNVTDMSYIFEDVCSLESLDLSHFNTSNVTNMSHMFSNSVEPLNISNFDTNNVRNMSYMFSGTSVGDIANWNTSKVENMEGMFFNAIYISLDLSSWDVHNVQNMFSMFARDDDYMSDEAISLVLNNWDVKNVKNMSYMFTRNGRLEHLETSGWNPRSVLDMSYMFAGLTNILSLDCSNWDARNVENMERMFAGLNNITTLNLTAFKTLKVQNMSHMFMSAFKLPDLDLSGFDTRNVTDMSSMFFEMEMLKFRSY